MPEHTPPERVTLYVCWACRYMADHGDKFCRQHGALRPVVYVLAPEGQEPEERIVSILEAAARTYTPEGVGIWLTGRKRSLGGRSPLQALRDGDVDAVVQIAAGLDGMVAT
jgi:hypothetical protein